MKKKKILFCCRYNDIYSKKLIILIRKFKDVKLTVFFSKKIGEKINKKYLKKYNYIFSYRSYLKINNFLLNKSNLCINFHPGPPKYRGIGALIFAIFNNEKSYGVTSHLISSKIDHGKIIKTIKFKINKTMKFHDILNLTHKKLYKLSYDTIKNILTYPGKKITFNKLIKWNKKIYNLKDVKKLNSIHTNITKKELNLRIKALNNMYNKPYIILHGHKFYLEK